jgi:hypothetical protein
LNALAGFLGMVVAPVALGAATLVYMRRHAARGTSGSWRAVAAGNVLLLLTLTSVVLLGFEIHLRFFYDASDGDNRTRISQRWFERHWQRNNVGLRDDVDYTMQRDPARRRFSFVGDSFTAGHGVADVGVRYANRLRRARPEWEVHTLAVPGFETPEETRLLRDMLRRGYELDVVILAYYIENLSQFIPELRQYYATAARPPPQPWKFLMQHSYAIETFAYRLQTRFMYARSYWSDIYERAYEGPAWEQQQAAFARFSRLVREHGGQFAVVTFPTLAGVEQRRPILERIDGYWKAEGVLHLDLLPVFEPYGPRELVANPHDAHPNAFAHRLAAEAIERFLVEQVLVTEGSSR